MHIFARLPLLTFILALLLLSAGCGPVIKPDQPDQVRQADSGLQAQVAALVAAGKHAAAAQLLETDARTAPPERRNALLLQAAELRARTGEWDKVAALLQQMPPLVDEAGLQQRMLSVELEISRQNLERAFELMSPPIGPDSPLPLQQRYYRNMAEIYRLTGNPMESARALVTLDSLLQGTPEQLANQQKLVQTLSTMTDTALSMLQPSPPGVIGGWMDLVRLVKQQNEDPANFEPRLAAWREQHPEHPALPELLSGFIAQESIDQSNHIAVLLPRTGPYANVAAAVRDGFMAAWYQRPRENRPALRFYDSSNSAQTLQIYQQAVQQGAQMMVGPLNKEAVNQLQHVAQLEIPVLALNQVDQTGQPTRNLFQFALAPEDEAEQTAERAWLDGHTKALLLTPNDDWGRRVLQSFRERWESLGGRIVGQQSYTPDVNDYSRPIRQLLSGQPGRNRGQPSKPAGSPLPGAAPRSYTPFIFLAARAQNGRQLGPQLKFYQADELPVYATSHIFDSSGNTEQDRDLGHILFVDTPWLLEDDSQSTLSRNQLQRLIPDVKGSYARLYALGIDAFNLLPHLPLLHQQLGPVLHGKTGSLYLDGHNRIHRQLAWAEINQGRAKITGYAPRLEPRQTPDASQLLTPATVVTPTYPASSPRITPLR